MNALNEKRARLQAVIDARKRGEKLTPEPTTSPAQTKTADVLPMRTETVTAGAQLAAVKQETNADRLQAEIEAENREFFVAPEGGRVCIFRETTEPETGLPSLTAMSQAEYRLLRANRFLQTTDGNGNTKTACVAAVWISHPSRREYPNGLVLLPGQDAPEGVYNLWRGFGVTPTKGDPKPALQHVRNVICAGDDTVFKYVIQWLAFAVQHPGDPAEVAIVLRGGRGTGKGFLGRWMREIFGAHGLHVLHSRHLVGNFNAHLRGACFMFCDEAFFAGDRAGADVLKGLVTEPTITIERKGVDAFTARNRLKILMASNSDWVVPAGTDERRFLVLDVSDCRKQNHDYFANLDAHMKNGGLAALLHFLLHVDICGFNIRAVPNTSGLDRQKLLSLPPLLAWLYDRLYAGHLLDQQSDWLTEQRRDDITKAFADYVQSRGLRHVRTDTWSISKGLHDVFPGMGERRAGGKDGTGKRPWLWLLPELNEARGLFEVAVLSGRGVTWPESEH